MTVTSLSYFVDIMVGALIAYFVHSLLGMFVLVFLYVAIMTALMPIVGGWPTDVLLRRLGLGESS